MGMQYVFQENDALTFAREQGINVNLKSTEIVFRKCPYCGGETNDKYKFSINRKTGMFHCFRASCNVKGNMITLAKDFDFPLGDGEVDEYYRRKRRHFSYKFSELKDKLKTTDAAKDYMGKRGISEKVLQKYNITTTSDGQSSITFPFVDPDNNVTFIKYRNPNPKGNQSKEWSQADGKPILFGMYQCNRDNKTLIVTEGQIDSLSVDQAGIENAVSVPTGANGFTWVPYCWNWMENFEKIIVFGDHEKNHITLYDEFVSRWHSKVWHVREEDYKDCKDANEILQKYGPEQIRICIQNAISTPIPKIKKLSQVKYIDPNDIERLPTGINAIDTVLKGGMPFGQVILITGKAGDGKSTLASQLLLSAIENGYKCLAYSGELPNSLFKAWIDYQAAGYWNTKMEKPPWSTTEIPKITQSAISQISQWYDDAFWIYDDMDIENDDSELDELLPLIEGSINQYGVRVVLIDNLMTALDLVPQNDKTDKYDQQSRFMKQLVKLAMKYQILIILVAHKRKDTRFSSTNDSVSGSADITNLVSIVMSYERGNDPEKISEEDRVLKITKNRLFGTLCINGMVLSYEPTSKRIYKTEKEKERRYGWEIGFEEDSKIETLPFVSSFADQDNTVPF